MDYDHFVGTYAFEATPFWPEAVVERSGESFTLKSPEEPELSITLKATEGNLEGQHEKGQICLKYNADDKVYLVEHVPSDPAKAGSQDIPPQFRWVKIKPSPNAQLEKEYGVKAPDLVRAVRDGEDWIHQAKSFQIKATDKWVKTPKGIAHRTQELQTQFPNTEISSKRFIRPTLEGELAIVFDDARFRTYNYTKEGSMFLHIWNGREFIAHEKYFTHAQELYAFRKSLGETENVLVHLMWPRSQFHSFWWNKHQMENWQDFYGRAEEFILTGKRDYRGTQCYVLECYPKDYRRVRRWLVGTKDHLRHSDQTYETGQLTWEQWTTDYKQIKPGWWFPMVQGYHIFERDETMQSYIASTRDITVEDVRIDEALPDELFVMEFKEGVDVNDDRFGGFVTYKYKKDRTEDEWEEIHQKAQKRIEADNAEKRALDERIGQTALEFPKECKWVNTEPLTMEKMRGKAVVLQFWGIWCGPCHNYMGVLSAKPETEDIVVIGIHTPEEDLTKIKADMDKYKADGPVFVDTGDRWGTISEWYHVQRRPYWVVIGRDGKVLGHADNPADAFQLAQKESVS
ncbi:MAG: redoxin domain-containing protein [Planctomycetaceae bacterium]|nr:redoxin domain-containing protein [Planctomycetaceae bacterium]